MNCFDKPYYFFGDYLRHKYKTRVYKLSINANFSCPNRDGTLDTKGCIFCSPEGSASPLTRHPSNILEQLGLVKSCFKRLDNQTKYISYFQAFTNTYAKVDHLKRLYDLALQPDNIIGLMIGTRPDCLSEKILDLIASYQKDNFELWLEIGMQTIHDKSLDYLNRKHNFAITKKKILEARDRDIPVCVHLILGIPGESWPEMMATAEEISNLPIQGIKFHHFHVIKRTVLEKMYKNKPFKLLTMSEYVSVICDFLERIRGDIIIHRLSGDKDPNFLVAPLWGKNKGTIKQAIEDEFQKRCTYQGFLVPGIGGVRDQEDQT